MGKKGRVHELQVILLILILILVQNGDCIWLNLPKSGRKCVTEEIHNNVVVLADYVVISDVHIHPTPSITTKYFQLPPIGIPEAQALLVTSPYGNILHHTENATHGQFAFTTNEAGQYLVCFWADDPNQAGALSVNIDWRTGIAAKDWESVARKEKIEGVELELRKLEAAVEAIHDNLIYLKTREAEIREVSETTNYRVALYSVLSLGICVAASVAQLWYLTRFFQKKKLI